MCRCWDDVPTNPPKIIELLNTIKRKFDALAEVSPLSGLKRRPTAHPSLEVRGRPGI